MEKTMAARSVKALVDGGETWEWRGVIVVVMDALVTVHCSLDEAAEGDRR